MAPTQRQSPRRNKDFAQQLQEQQRRMQRRSTLRQSQLMRARSYKRLGLDLRQSFRRPNAMACSYNRRSSMINDGYSRLVQRSARAAQLFSSIVVLLMVAMAGRNVHTAIMKRKVVIPDSMFIPGGGGSALFHRFGQLKSIPRERLLSQTNVCNSAGCIALVAVLLDWSEDQLLDVAETFQQKYSDGTYHRQEFTPRVIDTLLQHIPSEPQQAPEWLSNIRVLTTTSNTLQEADNEPLSLLQIASSLLTMRTVITTPSNKEELREVMVQSAWIPVALAPSFHHNGHNDGFFSAFDHPECSHRVAPNNNLSMLLHVLNTGMSKSKQKEFIAMGKEFGIDASIVTTSREQ